MDTDATLTDKTRLISLTEASQLYGLDNNYLGQLARRQRLKAKKIAGVWLTTPNDVEAFIQSRQKRGFYRKDIQIS